VTHHGFSDRRSRPFRINVFITPAVRERTYIPKRWIVERTIAWLNRCRRLAKDWENLNCSSSHS
jgi:transposase